MNEAALVQKLRAYLLKRFPHRCWVRKLADRYTRGLPDLVCVIKVKPIHLPVEGIDMMLTLRNLTFMLLVEAKRADGRGRLSRLQQAEMDEFNRVCADATAQWIVVKSVEELEGKLKEIGL